jgi:CheY-like chemotaxis protein
MKVLVVEDEELLLKAISDKLLRSGFEVVSCLSGRQAIEALGKDDKLPDAIWLDYYLKDMDGLEFMEQLKTEAKWAKIPVMVVSNSATPEKVQRMLALGANEYLLKAEYRLDDLIARMQSVIAGVKTAA